MALAAIHVKKPREAQIWNYSTGNLVLRILPDSNNMIAHASTPLQKVLQMMCGKNAMTRNVHLLFPQACTIVPENFNRIFQQISSDSGINL